MESLEERRLLSALAIGDIAFTGYQATAPDKVSFVLLADISGTTTVTVTDNAWTGAALAASEGNSVVTLTGNFTAGTQFNYDATRTAGLKWAVGTTTTGITDVTGANFSLNASGDNLFAYNGSSAPTTGNSALWIAGFASNAFLTTGTQTASLTYLPSALTAGDTALSLGIANATANENGALTGPSSISGTPAAIRAVVNTLANWTTFTAAGAQAIPPNISFTIGAANTSPTISTNTGLTVDEAATAAIDSTKLAAIDTEQGAASLTFTIGTAATRGALKKSGTTLLAGGTFTQADIDAGLITYEHDGNETTSDSFTFTVTDGAGGSSALTTFNITVTALNDAPTLTTNTGLSGVVLSTTTTISVGNLLVSDVDNTAAQLTYTLGTEPAGLLKLSGATLTSGGTFTQADINAGLVTYTAPASGTTDSFTFTLSDGAGGTIGSTTVSITLTSGNTSPTVAVNTGLTLNEGSTATIATANLQVTDSEQGAVSLTFTLDAVPARGLLKKSGTTLNVNDTFTQADIDAGLITYVHDGSETTSDSFSFLISDGAGGTVGSTTFAFTVTPVNDTPVLTTNAGLTVLEGAAATVIGNSLLQVSDNDNTAGQIIYTLTTIPAGGTLAKSGLALAISDTFTQADVDAGLITYAHAGGESPSDSFQFTVSDGAGGTIAATSFAITVTAVNDAPANTINRTLTLNPGQVVAISNAILLATDVDTGTGSLNYSVTSGPTRGTITKNGVAVTAFTQNDLNAGDTAAASIRYAATTAVAGDTDAITLSLSDGTTTVTVTLNISIVAATAPASFTGSYSQNFDNLLPTPVPGNNSSLPGAMVLPQGWLASETGTNSNNSVRIDAGSQATGDAYFYGALGSNERALGTQASGSNDPVRIGLTLTNDSGTTITSLNLSYIGEQWRKGTSTVDRLSFSYSTSASSLTTGTYTAVTALDFTPPGGGTNDQARDGNLVANQVNVSGTITGLTWAPGATLYLRWSDVNSTGNDDGMAVDAVSITTANSLPAQIANTGLSLGVGATEEITTAKLQHTDAEQAASALTYTLTSVPVSGQLKLNGTTLVANDTFTQADIDNHLLTFTATQAGLLSFGFTVSDGQGGVTAPATFQITAGTAASNVYINEVVFNPEAVTDTGEEYIELRGTPNTFVPTDVYLILLEGDSEDGSGSVDHIFNIGGMAFGSNGYLVLRQAGSTYTVASGANDVVATGSGWGTTFSSRVTDIENGAVSVLIIQTASAPVADSDVDADDNGTLDGAAAAWTVRDAIGNIDGGASDTAYGSFNTSGNGNGLVPAGSTFINLSGYHPDYMGRNGDSTGYTAADWVVGELAGAMPNVTLATGGFTSPSTFEGAPLNHIGSSNAFSTTNTPPTITSGTAFNVAENTTAVTTVTATDPDAGTTLTYSISGGADAALFSINSSTGALTFLAAPNFEAPADAGANNVYEVQVSVSDGSIAVTQDIAVTVTNVNETPAITSGAAFNVAENTTAVATVTATDPDAGATLTYAISGGADAALFSINATTGALTILAAPDFEAPADAGTNNVYDVQVSVSDGVNAAVTQDIAVTVTNVNEVPANTAPVFISGTAFNVSENTTAVTTVTANDADLDTLTYAISGGADAALFSINASTGALTLLAAPNFEAPGDAGANNVYDVQVSVSDGVNPAVTQDIAVTVTNVNETPTITSGAAFNVAENTTAVATVTATDPDAGATLTYSISGGADAALFSINASTGALTFPAAPNFEALADAGANNVYDVQVSVSDGSIAVTQDIAVTVTNVNEAPVITSGNAFTVNEANTNGVTGSQSSASPYLTSTNPNVKFTSILTVGDAVGGYRMVGIPDGMGAYDNGDGTFTLLMNHEIVNTLGVARAHGQPGAFVSRWVINKSTLQVVSIQDFLPNNTSVYLSNNNQTTGTVHTGYLAAATTVISRLCSADLAAPGAYQWTDTATGTVYGTSARIFQSGEESGGSVASPIGPEASILFGRQFAFVATDDPNTALNEAGTAWELPHAGLFSWENNLANPLSQRKTIVMGMDDGSPTGQIYMWVGDKQTTGNVVERAGLTKQGANDNMFVLKVTGLTADGTGATNETLGSPVTGTFTMENEGDVSGLTLAGLETLSDSKGATQFLRPEDGQWDPNNPSDFYFVTTSQYDQTKDGVGSTTGRSRLYKLHFTDISNPEAGGTITCLLDGTEGGNMFDNMTVSNGKIIIQEDVGNQQHLGKVWSYDIATDTLTQIAQHDRARFGDVGVTATAPFNQDEESSGVVDVSDILGAGYYLAVVQAHYAIAGELVEGGQLLMMQTNVTSGSQFVTTVTASDVDFSPLTYSISGGADMGDFAIDSTTGELSFVVAPNFEAPADADASNVYAVEVSVSDGTNTTTQTIMVTVSDVNESPTNTTVETVSVAENTTAVTTATGTDPEGVALAFAISGGADGAKFTINSVTGALSFIAAPNFEAPTDNGANNSYFVTVTISDGVNAPVNKTVVVTVTNANEAPTITSGAAFNVAENTTAVTTVTATDPDAGTTLAYSISGGADAALFSINASTGALTFLAAPNFEAPADAGGNNVYDVQVSVSDGSIAVTQDIAVTVTNVNEGPSITSGAAFNVAENTTAVTTVVATDPDAGTSLTYSISGGADATLFSINASTGALRFVAAPDFETPTDAGSNNVYDVQVSVRDGTNPAVTQDIAVTVTNVDETTGLTYSLTSGVLSVVGTSGDDIITVFNDAGAIKIDNNGSIIDTGARAAAVTGVSISGLGGNDTLKIDLSLGATVLGSLLGGDGNDLLISGRGNDLFDGGNDTDEASFIQAASGVNVYLATTGPQNTAGAGTDRLVQVENLTGSNFNDNLFGNAGVNQLFGGAGNDNLDGLGGADALDGGIGNDTLTFDALDTSVVGGADNDRAFVSGSAAVSLNMVTGQIEAAYATSSAANNTFDASGAAFAVTVIGGSGNDTILGGNANDNLSGGAGADSLGGGSGNDTLDGGTGADALDAGAGADTLYFDNLDTSVIGGADADRSFVTGTTGPVNYNLATGQMEIVYAQSSTFNNVFDATGAAFGVSIYGGSGNDTITGGTQNDVLSGGGGNDSLTGNAGNDSLDGGTGADSLDGGIGADSLTFDNFDVSVIGGADVDRAFISGATTGVNYNLATGLMEIIYAQSSTQPNTFDATGATFQVFIYGGSGNDTIVGGDQNDVLSGGGGNDVLIGNLGNDNIDGGIGIDTVSYVTAGSSVNVNLATFRATGGAGIDSLFNLENVIGSNFDDVINGNALDNILDGGAGLDIITGGGGTDTIL